MLTFIVFVILGISGALLMFYYQPILDRAWDSVHLSMMKFHLVFTLETFTIMVPMQWYFLQFSHVLSINTLVEDTKLEMKSYG